MYTIGSYAIPQIKSVNPDMNIGTFTFPANEDEADNVLNSGIDVQFCVMKACKNKDCVDQGAAEELPALHFQIADV